MEHRCSKGKGYPLFQRLPSVMTGMHIEHRIDFQTEQAWMNSE
jgi:hypothetical protein